MEGSTSTNGSSQTELPLACVTGASGFIACHVIKDLLESGKYRVRGTVRSIKDLSKYKYLTDLDTHNPSRLELVSADLTDDSTVWEKAIQGCDYVFHIASPYTLSVNDPQKDLVDPAVNGTLSVLGACSKVNTVKRVVLTSSFAAVTDSPENGYIYTEKDWNKTSSLDRNPYYYSKTVAEQSAWKFMKDHPDLHFNLVVINPFVVIGPHIAGGVNESTEILASLLNGKFPGILALTWGFVDVRDVSKAHILGMENPKAEGRYIVVDDAISMKDVVALLKEEYGSRGYSFPSFDLTCGLGKGLTKLASNMEDKGTKSYIQTNLGKVPQYNCSKVKGIGLEYRPIKQAIIDTVDDLIKNGHIKAPAAQKGKKSK